MRKNLSISNKSLESQYSNLIRKSFYFSFGFSFFIIPIFLHSFVKYRILLISIGLLTLLTQLVIRSIALKGLFSIYRIGWKREILDYGGGFLGLILLYCSEGYIYVGNHVYGIPSIRFILFLLAGFLFMPLMISNKKLLSCTLQVCPERTE